MKDLIIQSFKAHQKHMYYRMSSIDKTLEFLKKSRDILEFLESDLPPGRTLFMKLPKKDYGGNIAIDIYKEICYNVDKKFVSGRLWNEGIIKL